MWKRSTNYIKSIVLCSSEMDMKSTILRLNYYLMKIFQLNLAICGGWERSTMAKSFHYSLSSLDHHWECIIKCAKDNNMNAYFENNTNVKHYFLLHIHHLYYKNWLIKKGSLQPRRLLPIFFVVLNVTLSFWLTVFKTCRPNLSTVFNILLTVAVAY